jgi:hypothetical protein
MLPIMQAQQVLAAALESDAHVAFAMVQVFWSGSILVSGFGLDAGNECRQEQDHEGCKYHKLKHN